VISPFRVSRKRESALAGTLEKEKAAKGEWLKGQKTESPGQERGFLAREGRAIEHFKSK